MAVGAVFSGLNLGPRIRGYRREYAAGDLTAGLLVAALAVPQALGYAAVAGVPVQVGLYTLPPALLAYALVGSSKVLYVGPVSTVTVLSGTLVAGLSGGDPERAAALTSALAIMAGIVLLVAGLVRIGWVARFLNEPIITGFVTGLVVLIVVGEIPGLLGLPAPEGALLDRLLASGRSAPEADLETALTGLTALVVLFGGQRLAPRLPWALLVLAGGIAASSLLGLADHGVAVVGSVPAGMPLPSLPAVGLADIGPLVTGGVAIAGVGIAEGLAAARTFAPGGGSRARIHDDRELVANGAADVAAGLFSGMGVAGSLSKTAANARAGARTQASSVVSAVAVLVVVLFATELLAPLPRAVLSAIVINAVWGLVRPAEFARYRRVRRNDGVAAMVALVGVLVLGPLNGLLLAIAQSLLGLVYRTMEVHIDEMGRVPGEKAAWGAVANDPERAMVPGVMVIRPDGPIFWANVEPAFDQIDALVDAQPEARAVLLDLEATNQMDTQTAERLLELLRRLRERDVELYLVRVFGRVRGVLGRAGVLEELGEGHLWHSISAGVKAARRAPSFTAVPSDAAPGVEEDEEEPEEDQERIISRWHPRNALSVMSEGLEHVASRASRRWQEEGFPFAEKPDQLGLPPQRGGERGGERDGSPG